MADDEKLTKRMIALRLKADKAAKELEELKAKPCCLHKACKVAGCKLRIHETDCSDADTHIHASENVQRKDFLVGDPGPDRHTTTLGTSRDRILALVEVVRDMGAAEISILASDKDSFNRILTGFMSDECPYALRDWQVTAIIEGIRVEIRL
jgi:hypothetical protein